MRQMSAGMIKRTSKAPFSALPRDGSELRKLYDFFQLHAGEWVMIPPDLRGGAHMFGQRISSLRDEWGLVLHMRRVSWRSTEWLLEGE